ncbi:unnamed protein product [Caenorhabditis angaria]|uniref:K Homology domain-containing protein n=2 Tax=Caenorhabditis angaria TaxID=860376 RepID=A0A9P1IHE8_9PELO|nr:unnamed protein product [Caenorhabditis angaria]
MDCFLTDLQRKFLDIICSSERDPQTLFQKDPECDGQLENVTEYFKMLLIEKCRLQKYGQANFAIHLLDEEICRLFMAPVSISDINLLEQCGQEALRNAEMMGMMTDSEESMICHEEEVTLTENVYIPVDEYPSYNFIGRIIGPRGTTAKQLEKATGCRIMIRGKYSNKTYGYSQRQSSSETLADSRLRVVLQTCGIRAEAEDRMRRALYVINSLLIPPPDGRDELKRRQLSDLAVINGTYRPTSIFRS